MISCGKEEWSKSLKTKLWHRAGEFLYSWGRTVKLYSWPCQLKVSCKLVSDLYQQVSRKSMLARSIDAAWDTLFAQTMKLHFMHRLQLLPMHLGFPVSWPQSPLRDMPKKNDHRALEGYWSSPHKSSSHSCKRCGFWLLPGWVVSFKWQICSVIQTP